MAAVTLTLAEAEALAAAALRASRTAAGNAQSVARALVAAEADGLKGHGLSRVPSYAAQAQAGKVDGYATPEVESSAPSVLQIDAACGFAYPALDLAAERLIPLARQQGAAVAAIRRSHHCGALGLVVERFADQGLAALMVANTPSAIAPPGGRRGLFGTNPIALAVSRTDAPPLVIDLAVSKVARGNILSAKQKGERIPPDWAFDAQGEPTTDPAAALGGTMAPMGGPKGAVLAFMIELLAAGLTGARFAGDASSYFDAEGPPSQTGQLIVAFDPQALGGSPERFAELARAVADEPGARLPGSRREAARAHARAHGVAIEPPLVAAIAALAEGRTA